MSSPLATKKFLIVALFVLFSLIFVGGVFAVTNETVIDTGNELSYPLWLVIAYLAGLSMIILPCTLPLVFIIVPLRWVKVQKRPDYGHLEKKFS